jgi:hypothetical protein
MKFILLYIIVIIEINAVAFGYLWAQKTKSVTLSGTVRDSETDEPLVGANIRLLPVNKGTQTNENGRFALNIEPGNYSLEISYIGYNKYTESIELTKNSANTFKLLSEGKQLDAIIIKADGIKDALNQTRMSVTRLETAQIRKIPAIFGEVDIVKAIQFLPGIKAGTEGTAGFFVRGGGADQNLVLLDDAPIYNASHVGGLFSVFNPDAIQGLEVYKGNFPARYGGRLSSVLDIQMREGKTGKYGISGGIGLISSRLTAEGPLPKKKGSFLISGRRTYFDIFTRIINRMNQNKPDYNPIPDYYFYDLNAKLSYTLSTKDRLFISGYFGQDIFNFNTQSVDFDFFWGNLAFSSRWNHFFNPKHFLNVTAFFSQYRYKIANQFSVFSFGLYSRIENYGGKAEFVWTPTAKHNIRYGTFYTWHTFTPTGLNVESIGDSIDINFRQRIYGQEFAAWFSDDYDLTQRLRISAGIRLAGFAARGKTYLNPEPRLALRYKLSETWSFKSGYSRVNQYVHLASSGSASLPTDIWYPSTAVVRPQYADQIAAGLTYALPKQEILITIEGYYKWMNRLVELREGAQLFINPNLENDFTFGRGESYGTELLVEKRTGKLTGWLGYTLAWANRTFPDLNRGRTFPYRFDIRHDLSLVLAYDISKSISLSAAWVYRTGVAVTLPQNRFAMRDLYGIQRQGIVTLPDGSFTLAPGLIIPNYADRNSFRMPAFHRADLGITYKFRPKRGESELNLSFYNLYNRRNPFFLYFDPVENDLGIPTQFKAKIIALFPIIPSLTYNFKF